MSLVFFFNFVRKFPKSLLCLLALSLLVPTSQAEEEGFQYFTGKVQSTWVWQKHPSFNAPYSGPASVSSQNEVGHTITGTAFFGARPWKGTEIFIDPEVAQGSPFSGLKGFGGMTNGEAQKAGTTDAVTYWSRAFIRQTIGFGGGTIDQETSFNQFAGSVDKRRLVLTGGVYAITDIFDQNSFSHDPKTQFLNWSMMDYGAWDFPADARGYTRGITVEYYNDDWAFRIGRNLLPVESNGLQLNGDWSGSYSDNLEIEKAHEIFGQPGKLRILGFRNQGKFGNFNDALNYANQYGGSPDVANVRSQQTKTGYGLSLEQNITEDLGVFARYSWNNGQTEAYAFTEINNSALVGVSIKGTKWSRPEDVIGIAYASNGISNSNIDYMRAGGITAFCGDGNINYQREGIMEVYYSVKINKVLWATADFQRINNPCYNADRGPVNVYSVRMHFEY